MIRKITFSIVATIDDNIKILKECISVAIPEFEMQFTITKEGHQLVVTLNGDKREAIVEVNSLFFNVFDVITKIAENASDIFMEIVNKISKRIPKAKNK